MKYLGQMVEYFAEKKSSKKTSPKLANSGVYPTYSHWRKNQSECRIFQSWHTFPRLEVTL